MPIDRKYGRVTLENQRNVGDDEPVVVFRAEDRFLPMILNDYYRRCRDGGSPLDHLDLIVGTIKQIDSWQAEHGSHTPRSEGVER